MGDTTNIGIMFWHPSELAGKTRWGGYVYVLHFKDGLIKVGFTSNPASRIDSHRSHAEAFGNPLIKGWLSPWHENCQANEKALIAEAGRMASSVIRSEYFVGVGFGRLVRAAKCLAFLPVDVEAHEARSAAIRAAWAVSPNGLAAIGHRSAMVGRHEDFRIDDPAGQQFRDLVGSWFGRDGNSYTMPDGHQDLDWPIVEQLAERTDGGLDAVLEMNRLHMIRAALVSMIDVEMVLAKRYALQNDRRDVLMTIGEELAYVTEFPEAALAEAAQSLGIQQLD